MRQRRRALLDANVLWSPQQRNILLQIALQETISAHWSEEIEREWLRNTEPRVRDRLTAVTLPLLRRHFPNAWVEDVDPLVQVGDTDDKDVHVAVAAIKIGPCPLVTWNIADFDMLVLAEKGVSVQTPDAFLSDAFDSNPELIYLITREAWENLTRSVPTWDGYLEKLSGPNKLVSFVARLRDFELGSH